MSSNLTTQSQGALTPQQLPHIINQDKVHYGINLGPDDLSINAYGFDKPIARGSLFVIKQREEFINSSNWDTTNRITSPNGGVLSKVAPGTIAAYLNREFSRLGIYIVLAAIGLESQQVIHELSVTLNFLDIDPSETNWQPCTNMEKIARLNKAIKSTGYPKAREIYLEVLGEVERRQAQAPAYLASMKKEILDGRISMLSDSDKRLCAIAGLSVLDYEVHSGAQELVMQKMYSNLMNLGLTPDTNMSELASLQKENEAFRSQLLKQGEQLAALMEKVGELGAKPKQRIAQESALPKE